MSLLCPSRGQKNSLVTVALIAAFCVAFGKARKESGVGSDCLHPLSDSARTPIFGACRRLASERQNSSLPRKENPLLQSLQAEQLLLQTDEPPKQWIVLWNPGEESNASQEACLEAADPASSFQGECTSTFSNVLSGISIQLTEDNLVGFLERYSSRISSVHEDTGVLAHGIEQNPTWSLDRLDQAFLPLDSKFYYYNLGSNVNVYIIDTGVQISHSEFRYPDGRPGSRAREAYTSLTSGQKGFDCNGHGTHVAGTVGGLTYGPAKNATLYAVRSLECLGNGTITQVIDGLDWLADNFVPPAVAVLALGGDAQYALDQAAHNLVLAGVPVVVAAGNDGVDACNKSPARDPLVITVAATDTDDQRLWLSGTVASNIGPCVDVWAPGANILSASTRSNVASDYRSGTSQAAPYVAGGIALFLENQTDSTPSDVSAAVKSWAVPNIITEPTDSSPNGQRYLNTSNNLLLNIPKTVPVLLSPTNCTLRPGFLEKCTINVTLTQEPQNKVTMNLVPSDTGRGAMDPPVLYFTADNYSNPQQVSFNYVEAALTTARSALFSLYFKMTSDDVAFNGRRAKAWVADRKGDYFTYPKVVDQVPFLDYGNTYFFENSYNLQCGSAGSSVGRDVAYYFQPQEDTNVTISLCGNTSEPFNTQLILLADLNSTNISAIACNDDFCGYQSLLQVNLTKGVAYGILVESRDGRFGTYSLNITDSQNRTVNGTIPSVSSVKEINRYFPQDMIAGANSSGFVVSPSSTPPGSSPPTPKPAPPPLAVVGTIPGPDVSLALPNLVNLSDYTAGSPVSAPVQSVPQQSGGTSYTIAAVLAPTKNASSGAAPAPGPAEQPSAGIGVPPAAGSNLSVGGNIVNVVAPTRPSPPSDSSPLVSSSVQGG